MTRVLLLAAFAVCSGVAFAQEPAPVPEPPSTLTKEEPPKDTGRANRHMLVEEFTAHTLESGELKVGSALELGLTSEFMIGTDLIAAAVGATTLSAQTTVLERGKHKFALGLRGAYLSKKTLLWGSVNEHFDKLEARVVRPSIAWTHTLSPRLQLHTFWAKGFGRIDAKLSEKGRRKLWETKHPGADYDERNKDTQQPTESTEPPAEGDETAEDGEDSENQEKASSKKSSLTQQSIQVQSITGLAQERFQLTGEFTRASGNKVLVTSRIEQTEFEKLKSNFFRLTVAHQWIWSTFQMRLGVGAQYYVLSGRDLDDELIDESGVLPASDIAFYWRF